MNLGTFSLSLSVKDITISQIFYENLGFQVIDGGHMHQGFPDSDKMKWRILENQSLKIGLFQGMFEKNIITFNPTDVLTIQKDLKEKGVPLIKEADPNSTGGMLTTILQDPDGNQIMLDQIKS